MNNMIGCFRLLKSIEKKNEIKIQILQENAYRVNRTQDSGQRRVEAVYIYFFLFLEAKVACVVDFWQIASMEKCNNPLPGFAVTRSRR